MFKGLSAVAGVAALAGAGVTIAAPPTNAAGKPAGSMYLHGTSQQAKFWSRSTCEAHAKWSVGQVTKSKNATLVIGYNSPYVQGSQLRTSCYPVRGAQWTYLTAYTSKSGAPVGASDKFVDLSNRLSELVNGDKTIDTERVWGYEHYIVNPVGSVSAKTCNGWLNWFINLAKVNPHARMVQADKKCVVQDGKISYKVVYLATTATAGLRLDKPLVTVDAVPMIDVLGYDYPLAQDAQRRRNGSGVSSSPLWSRR